MSKKGLLLAGIMCGVLTSTLIVAHCGKCGGSPKYSKEDKAFVMKALIDHYNAKKSGKKSRATQAKGKKIPSKRGYSKNEKSFVMRALVEHYNAKKSGKKSRTTQENYEKAVSMIKRGLFDSVFDEFEGLLEGISQSASTNEDDVSEDFFAWFEGAEEMEKENQN